MSEQPKALRLADHIENANSDIVELWAREDIAAELRRLHDRLNKTSERTLIQVDRIIVLKQAGRQALEALETWERIAPNTTACALRIPALTALRQALTLHTNLYAEEQTNFT